MLTFLPFLVCLWNTEGIRGLGDFVCMISCKFSLMYVIVWKRELLPNEMYIFSGFLLCVCGMLWAMAKLYKYTSSKNSCSSEYWASQQIGFWFLVVLSVQD